MTKSKIFYFSCLSFIFSIGFCIFFAIPAFLVGIFIILGICLIFFGWPQRKNKFVWSKNKTKITFLGFLLLAFGLGCFRFLFWQQQNISEISFFNQKEKIIFQGWISQQKTKTQNSNQLVLEAEKMIINGQFQKTSGRVLLILPAYANFKPGDFLEISGKLKTPQAPEKEGFFSYQKYLAKDGIYSLTVFPQVQKIGFKNKKPITFFLFKIKDAFEKRLSKILPQPQLSFLRGLMFGQKTGMTKQLKESFARTGTSHLVALSGFNITIITQSLAAMFLFFGISRRKIFWLSLLVISAFVLMVGAGSSVVRAAIMGLLFLYAKKEGRLYGAKNAVLFAGVLMLWLAPNDLVFDIGFQLSFLATLGLVYLTPFFSKIFKKAPEFFGFKESLVSTLSAQIFVLPVLIFYFQSLSLISPLANILILPFIPLTMLFGFLSAGFSFGWILLGKFFGWIAWLFLTYELGIINSLAGFPFSLMATKISGPLIIVFYYLVLGFFIWWWREREHQKFVIQRNEIVAKLKS